MRHQAIILLLAASALAGCTKKTPPPPPSASMPTSEAVDTPSSNAGAVGALGQADLIAAAGADRVLFALDSYSLSGEAQAILARQAEWLRQHPQVTLTIEGHCDERGTREYNLALGDRRAASVVTYLTGQGIAAARLNPISYGKERPEATGSDDTAYSRNRRAVSVVIDGGR
ncbi:peptidoglycan-associated lipoprotein Pal [Sphingomonas crocodyli]|uniref:Peptidoglycan-associated lipoprotein n=1 Tax=Sphingomonas crocodyli TaxID=1979270 RepID=A0A437LYV6_9SPHN|nr:peptidoglycan-associated lipoprotein Pal [Sphingomonas crocodyli]RVT90494.1 peptidoglycan-associated lipoprotein Pal [Sphingomonas crocodyli]